MNLLASPTTINLLPGNDPDIEYKLNSNGYRAPEWSEIDWPNTVAVFGDSNVFGPGLWYKETVVGLLEEHLNLPVVNIGAIGTSIDFSILNQTVLHENNIKPKAVINIWTLPDRMYYYSTDVNNCWNLGGWILNEGNGMAPDRAERIKPIIPMFKEWHLHPDNALHHMRSQMRLCRQSWKLAGVPMLEFSWFLPTAKEINKDPLPRLDVTGDRSHPGPKSNSGAADVIYKELTEIL